MSGLDGAAVMVFGGSSGIGLGTATAAMAAGAKVTVAGRDPKRLAAAGAAVSGVETVPLDAADEAALAAFFAGRAPFDHVVVSVGMGGRGRIAEQKPAEAMAAFEAKFWTYYRVARTAKIVPGGSLTVISGVIGHQPAPGAALISAINAAVEGLTRGLAVDFAPTRVNTVCPGLVDTALWDRLSAADRQAMYARAAATLPARRVGQPADIAQAVLMMMTNPFVTGTTLVVDGGALLGGARDH
ncbi:MAG TPA: SDR family oxidoreductase [Hyphomicrobiales bacterium]|nr:SDR family oxidoreductase [Hyphomicrobiales bacterium]